MTGSLIAEIREDDQFALFTRVLLRTKKGVDVEAFTNEVLGLHAGRTSRRLYGDKRYSPKALLDADSNDLAARARMAEIRVKADLRLSTLRDAVAAMRRHILTTYADDLKEFAGVTAKKAVADRVMKSAITYLAEGEALLKTVDTLLKDLDQAGHSLHRMGVMVTLVTNAKGRQG